MLCHCTELFYNNTTYLEYNINFFKTVFWKADPVANVFWASFFRYKFGFKKQNIRQFINFFQCLLI